MGPGNRKALEIDIGNRTLRLQPGVLVRCPKERDEVVVTFLDGSALFHLAIIALVAKAHEGTDVFKRVELEPLQEDIELLARIPELNGNSPLKAPYQTIYQAWRMKAGRGIRFRLKKRFALTVGGKTRIPRAQEPIAAAFESLLCSEGSPDTRRITLSFNPEECNIPSKVGDQIWADGLDELKAELRKLPYRAPGSSASLRARKGGGLADLHDVPDLPPNCLPREAEVRALKEKILAGARRPNRTVAIAGSPALPEPPHIRAIIERHREIIGRSTVKEGIRTGLDKELGGFIVVTGAPGSGKTALLSHLVTDLSSLSPQGKTSRFFFRKGDAASSARVCLQCLLANLISKYSLQTDPLPAKLDLLAELLENVLHQVATRLNALSPQRGQKELLIIDALDAADNPTDVVRSLPKNLPENLFILVSSREGPQLDLLRTSIPPDRLAEFSLDPSLARPEQFEDACAFLKKRFPTWTHGDIQFVVSWARGNFQIIDAFSSACPATVKPDEALALARKLGRQPGDPFTSIYRHFWQQLRCRAISHGPQTWDDVVSLLGLLSVAFESLTETQLVKLSGAGTYGRMDVARGFVQEFLIEDTGSVLFGEKADCKSYTIYHDTFRDFLLEQLSNQVEGIHDRIAKTVLASCHAGAKPELLDAYALRHGVAHAAVSSNPAACRAIISPEYVRHKSAKMQSVGPVWNDVSLAIEGCCRANEFTDALSLALLKQRLSSREWSALAGVQAALSIQMGNVTAGLSQAESLGGTDDRLLALAQVIASKSEVGQPLVQNCRAQVLSAAQKYSPWALEVAAEMIAVADPQSACELARQIPEPKALMDYGAGEENPTSGRCIFRVFQRLAGTGSNLALEAAGKLVSAREQALAYVAIGSVTFGRNVPGAAALFRKGLALLPDKAQRRYLMTRYFLSQALRQPSEKAADILLVLDRDFALRPEHLMVRNFVDQQILAAPGQWLELRTRLRSEALRSFVSWRLVELGHLSPSAVGKRASRDISDLLLASAIARSELTNPAEAAESARQLKSLAGFGSVFAAMLKRVGKRNHKAASILASQVMRSLSEWPAQSRLLALTWLIEDAFELGPAQGAALIAPCLAALAEWEPRCDRHDAEAALWVPISRFVGKSPARSASRFQMILQVADSERWKELAATKILTYCDVELCRALARKPEAFGLLDRNLGEEQSRRNALLPETQISIMLVAARRLGVRDRPLACQVLAQSSDYTSSIVGLAVRQECMEDVITSALIVSPAFAKQLLGNSLPGPAEFLGAAKAAVYEFRSRQAAAENILRCQIEMSLPPEDLRDEKLRQFFVARRRLALQEDISCPALAIADDSQMAMKEWLGEFVDVIAFFYERVDRTAGTSKPKRRKHDLYSLHEIAALIGDLDWPSFVKLAKHPSVGVYAMKNMSPRQLARGALIPESNRNPRFQQDLKNVLSVTTGIERTCSDESLEAYCTLLSAAAGVDPALCLELLAEMPTLDRPLDARSIMQCERRAPWTNAQAKQLFGHITTFFHLRKNELFEAGNLGWFATRMANPRFFAGLAARRAMAYEGGEATYRLSHALSAIVPDLTPPLFERALSRSLASGDDETLVATLRTAPNLPGGQIAEILRTRVQRRECDPSAHFLRDAAELQARDCPDDAITTLSLIRPGTQDLDKIIETLADALHPTSEDVVCAWYQRIAGLPAIGSKEADAFLGKLVSKAAKQHITISTRCIDQILASDKKVLALIAQASLCEKTEKGELLQHAATEARKAHNSFEATAASIAVAQAYLDFAPAEASALLQWGASQLLKHETAFGLASDTQVFSEACELMPAFIIHDVGPVLRDAVLNFPYGADYRKRGDEKARALVQVVCLVWGTDEAYARRTLAEACKAYAEALPLDYIGYWCGELCEVAKRIYTVHGPAVGASFVEVLFALLEPPKRGAVADEMMHIACEFSGCGRVPLEGFGILCPAVDEKREWLMNVLLPLSSEKMQAKAHIVRAANRWNIRPADCQDAVASAMGIVQKGTCKLDDKDWEALWILDVLTQGITRVNEAARQLLTGEMPQDPFRAKRRNTKLGERVTLLIRAACFVASNKRELMRQLWQGIKGLKRY